MFIPGYIASFVMGTSLGLIGAGGSILMVPILFYFFGQNAVQATTNSLFVVGVAAFAGALIKAKKGSISIKTGILFALPGFAGVYTARHFILPSLPDILFSAFGVTFTKPLLVMAVFAVTMAFSSWAMIRSGRKSAAELRVSVAAPPGFTGILLKGFLVGALTGFVGAGGGFLIIPALVLLLRLPLKLAVGTSLAIIAANSMFGFALSFEVERMADCPLLLVICILGIAGMFLGQVLSGKINERLLKKGFGYFAMAIASFILWDQVAAL